MREKAEADLEVFIKLVSPDRMLGQCHIDVIRWWTRQDAKSHQLLLLPRDHQKSALVAYRVAWEITKNPAIRVLYISSTSKLAIKQLSFIKKILTSDKYRKYWPLMVDPEETKREKWTETEICVDHPLRKQRLIRDPTVFTAGLTTGITGMHCDISVLDDVVVEDNAYSPEGREKVESQASYLASIAGTDSKQWVVGTRYHPLDLYSKFMDQMIMLYGPDGTVRESEIIYENHEKVVENQGDGTGEFLWPRMRGPDGTWYGFDERELAKKRAQYMDPTKFRAQYYNNPNDVGSSTIGREYFQYYTKQNLTKDYGKWYIMDRRLNVFAAIDFAYSLSNKADFTSIVVVGVDQTYNYYVLDIERFKTNKISDYFDKILKLHTKWGFRKIRAELNAAQEVIVKELRDSYIRPHGLSLSIDPNRPSPKEGSKEQRIESILQPKYANLQVWHYRGGNCELLEEELVNAKPAHDDIKDAFASCCEICVPPSHQGFMSTAPTSVRNGGMLYHPRFGGIG